MGGAGVDTRFEDNYKGVQLNALKTAFYHLFRPDSDGVPQAQHFLNTVQGKPYEFLAVDVERVVEPQRELTKAQYADELALFVGAVHDATGVYPHIYTSAGEWGALVGAQHNALFAKCPLWVANYTTGPTPLLPPVWQAWALWQYTSSGSVKGISTRVDMNRVPVVSTKPFTLQPPVTPPMRVTQAYGARVDYYKQFGLCCGHEGLDVGGKDGDPIYAAADGVIKLIAPDNGVHPYGAHVRITSVWHADTYEHIYAHLRGFKAGLMQGDTVHAGDVIGYVGDSGNADGIHLHMTLKRNGVIVNPETYLK